VACGELVEAGAGIAGALVAACGGSGAGTLGSLCPSVASCEGGVREATAHWLVFEPFGFQPVAFPPARSALVRVL